MTDQQISNIKNVREQILELQEQQNVIYDKLIEDLGLVKESKVEMHVFDIVYNSYDQESLASMLSYIE
jgi:hypothetical protein